MRFGRRRREPAAEALRPLLYGDVPMADWPPGGTAADAEPWGAFVRAREAYAAGRRDEAVRDWLGIARTPGAESRCVLQAWTFLRAAGVDPAPDEATVVHGVVLEVPVDGGNDVLAAYRDGSARYLNHSGRAAVVEEQWQETFEVVWAAAPLGERIGLWDAPELPPLGEGEARMLLLTPGGFRFGQGLRDPLFADPTAAPVVTAALRLLGRIAHA
ncbi:MAG TPA: hypothetical protein VGX28_13590 [Frankiaceae bacterium]|nr:hypothetical protein [Frankiaceae bacterium]